MDLNMDFVTSSIADNDDIGQLHTSNSFCRSRIYTLDISINPLVAACDPLLVLVATLKTIIYPLERDKFLQDLAHEIRAFECRAQMANYLPSTIMAARYALCCLLDETIAFTSNWGKDNGWLQNNLLTIFHNEGYGGAYFFTIISQALEDVGKNLHLIELLYLCLRFGFEGKYHNKEYDKNKLASIANRLYQIICQHRRTNNRRNLFICDEKLGLQPQYNHKLFTVPQIGTAKIFGIAIIVSMIISGCLFFNNYIRLHDISKPVYHDINVFNKQSHKL